MQKTQIWLGHSVNERWYSRKEKFVLAPTDPFFLVALALAACSRHIIWISDLFSCVRSENYRTIGQKFEVGTVNADWPTSQNKKSADGDQSAVSVEPRSCTHPASTHATYVLSFFPSPRQLRIETTDVPNPPPFHTMLSALNVCCSGRPLWQLPTFSWNMNCPGKN